MKRYIFFLFQLSLCHHQLFHKPSQQWLPLLNHSHLLFPKPHHQPLLQWLPSAPEALRPAPVAMPKVKPEPVVKPSKPAPSQTPPAAVPPPSSTKPLPQHPPPQQHPSRHSPQPQPQQQATSKPQSKPPPPTDIPKPQPPPAQRPLPADTKKTAPPRSVTPPSPPQVKPEVVPSLIQQPTLIPKVEDNPMSFMVGDEDLEGEGESSPSTSPVMTGHKAEESNGKSSDINNNNNLDFYSAFHIRRK